MKAQKALNYGQKSAQDYMCILKAPVISNGNMLLSFKFHHLYLLYFLDGRFLYFITQSP